MSTAEVNLQEALQAYLDQKHGEKVFHVDLNKHPMLATADFELVVRLRFDVFGAVSLGKERQELAKADPKKFWSYTLAEVDNLAEMLKDAVLRPRDKKEIPE